MTLKELAAKKAKVLAKCERLQADPNATVEEYKEATDELNTVVAEIKLQEAMETEAKATIAKKIEDGEVKPYDVDDEDGAEEIESSRSSKEYKNAFRKAVSGQVLTPQEQLIIQEVSNALSSGTGEDGGFLIPADQQTAIRELKRQMKALENEVNIEYVTTNSGSRNIEKDAEFTPFVEVIEGNDIPETDSPQFVNIPYAIKDRMGILPVPNNLLADNSAGVERYLNKWLAKKQVATRNALIMTILNTLTPTAIATFDDVKAVCNVQLDPAISDMAFVYTNQDGFNKLDTMKDPDGKYWLQPNPANPTQKMLNGKVVKVYSNKTMKTTGTTTKLAPIFIGSLKELITLFDRQALSLLATKIGGTAFGKNRTEIRAISREDVKTVDDAAVVFGQLDVTPV